MKQIQTLKGMKDITGENSTKFDTFIKVATEVMSGCNFGRVQTPILEELALFNRNQEDSSDMVTKEMYDFTDNGGKEVALRPEGTAGVVRSYIQNKLDRQPFTTRQFYFGSMFRYEQPQKGRYREFRQFGAESFGEASYLEDVQMITMLSMIFERLNIPVGIEINSLGCKECLPVYKQKLRTFTEELELCEDCEVRKETNVLRMLDCKRDTCQSQLKGAPVIESCLCDSCSDMLTSTKNILNELKIKFRVNNKLVRGLDYYNGLVFEVVSKGQAIAGGGRYDNLVKEMGGKSRPAVGFAIGIDRVIERMTLESSEKRRGIYIGVMTEAALPTLMKLAMYYRNMKNSRVFLDYKSRGPSTIIKNANKENAECVIILGDKEIETKECMVKWLEGSTQVNFDLKELN